LSFLEKAKQAAQQARQTAESTISQATSPQAQEQMRQTGTQFRSAAGIAGKGLVTAIERIDPSFLSDIIIKSTSLQEKVNKALRGKGSGYRIAEITITATIPPQIGFAISRVGDMDDEPSGGIESQHLLAEVATADEEVVSLEGATAPLVEEAVAVDPDSGGTHREDSGQS
jgi:hypothetical protein